MDINTLERLKIIYDEYCIWDLNIKDIEELEINNKTIAKYLNSYRFALVVQKCWDEWNDKVLNAQINLCSMLITELMTWLSKKRIEYYKNKTKKKK